MRSSILLIIALLLAAGRGSIVAAPAPGVAPSETLAAALPPADWQRVETCVDRALAWLASQQQSDGSFPTRGAAQPAVTSLCVLAFLSRGHLPGVGPYGAQINRAIDYVLDCQMSDGLFSYEPPEQELHNNAPSHTATYNHAIAGLMLGEVFGHVTGNRSKLVKQAVQKALKYTRELQTRPKKYPNDKGGWRYVRIQQFPADADSDLSVTGWQLMFLRSARNAEFKVPQKYIDEAVEYIRRTWDDQTGMFKYEISAGQAHPHGRGLMGSAILSLALSGQHHSPEALAGGDWLLAHPFRGYGFNEFRSDRFFYSTYYCSQAAAQLGGRYWTGIFPNIVSVVLEIQQPDGSFPPESLNDAVFGNDYSTAMAVLSLTPAYQILPVYQR
jgi:Prenyltransferase and squalene oxidase repeat